MPKCAHGTTAKFCCQLRSRRERANRRDVYFSSAALAFENAVCRAIGCALLFSGARERAVFEQDGAGSQCARGLRRAAEDHEGRALFVQCEEEGADDFLLIGIEVCERFVGKHDHGCGDDGAGDGDEAAFGEGKLVGEEVCLLSDVEAREKIVDAFLDDRFRGADELKGKRDIFRRSRMREKNRLLEDDPDSPSVELHHGAGNDPQIDAVDADNAARGDLEAEEEFEDRRLSAARGTDDAEDVLRIDLHGNIAEQFRCSICL